MSSGNALTMVEDPFELRVPYRLTLEEMIATARFTIIFGDVNSTNFPYQPQAEAVTAGIFRLNGATPPVAHEATLGLMEHHGWRPATIAELVTCAAEYPGASRDVSLLALGSVWRQSPEMPLVPAIRGETSNGRAVRRLYRLSTHLGWNDSCRFLAVQM